jgi:hypothetical protein
MKALSQWKPCACLAAWGKSLTKLRLQGDYNMDLGVYGDGQGEDALCSHKCNGTVSYSLWKLLAVLGALVLGMAILRAFCGLLSRRSS